ncbi:MAG TPA: hypothetical protein VGL72_02365 [Bryobacteraceae bacterium]|jgi:hypothetical protein
MRVELASNRKIRTRNKPHYRLAHWPIWIAVFFLTPGPWVFDLFEHGIDYRLLLWLGAVLLATGFAGLRGQLPGVEPAPYIIRFTEDKPNPLYRRVCYTFAWNAAISYAVLNLAGLTYAVATGRWQLKQIYQWAYFPILAIMLLLGAMGQLPRVKDSTRGEGTERRYFYGTIWAVVSAQPVLGILWKLLPRSPASDALKLAIFAGILTGVGLCAYAGLLPRTRPVVPGELAVSD